MTRFISAMSTVKGLPLPHMWHWPLFPQNQHGQSALLMLHLLGTQMLSQAKNYHSKLSRGKKTPCTLKTLTPENSWVKEQPSSAGESEAQGTSGFSWEQTQDVPLVPVNFKLATVL